MKIEYSGIFYTELAKLLSIRDGFSLGEKLTQLEKTSGKRFYDMTDEEIYNATQSLVRDTSYFKDEDTTKEEFKEWIDNKF